MFFYLELLEANRTDSQSRHLAISSLSEIVLRVGDEMVMVVVEVTLKQFWFCLRANIRITVSFCICSVDTIGNRPCHAMMLVFVNTANIHSIEE
jgi:hypothetical protein